MSLMLYATMALGAPPQGVDVQAIEVWQDRAIRLRGGPSACLRLEGTARSHVAVYRPPSLFGRADQTDYVYEGPISGTIDDGRWTVFESGLEPISDAARDNEADRGIRVKVGDSSDDDDDDDPDWKIPVHPFIGRSSAMTDDAQSQSRSDRAGSTSEAMSLVDRLLDEIDADVTAAFAQWDEDTRSVQLSERYPLGDSRAFVELTTRFPEGDPVASALDVVFPKRHRFKIEDLPFRITLLRPQLHVRTQTVDGEAVPVYESLSLAVGAFGFTVGVEQQITYSRATPCAAKSGATRAPTGPGEGG